VVVGETFLVPSTGTDPMPWSILQEVAPVVCQESVDEFPETMLVGLAVKLSMVGKLSAPGVTITINDAVLLSLPLYAIKVYVVVEVGVTTILPQIATSPTPGLILTVVALFVTQVRVTEFPLVIVLEFEVKVSIVTGFSQLNVKKKFIAIRIGKNDFLFMSLILSQCVGEDFLN
jgi:hypothetical protein